MTGQVNKTYEGEIIMNIQSAAMRLLAGFAQLTHLSHVYPCQPQCLSRFLFHVGMLQCLGLYKQQKCSLCPRKLLVVLYHFCSLQT